MIESWGSKDITILISGIALIVSILTNIKAQKHNEQALKTTTFLELRKRYLDIQRKIPTNHREERWIPKNVKTARFFEEYWYNAMNEWIVTTKLYKKLFKQKLWDTFYVPTINRALGHYSFKAVFCAMQKLDEDYGEVEREFFETVIKNYKVKTKDLPPGAEKDIKIRDDDIEKIKALLRSHQA